MNNSITIVISSFIILLAISIPASAIEVHGTAYNNINEPVRFAIISIYENPDYTDCLCSSQTDINGNFSISSGSLSEDDNIYVVAEKDNEFGRSENNAGEFININIIPKKTVLVSEFPMMALPITVMIALIFLISASKKND